MTVNNACREMYDNVEFDGETLFMKPSEISEEYFGESYSYDFYIMDNEDFLI